MPHTFAECVQTTLISLDRATQLLVAIPAVQGIRMWDMGQMQRVLALALRRTGIQGGRGGCSASDPTPECPSHRPQSARRRERQAVKRRGEEDGSSNYRERTGGYTQPGG